MCWHGDGAGAAYLDSQLRMASPQGLSQSMTDHLVFARLLLAARVVTTASAESRVSSVTVFQQEVQAVMDSGVTITVDMWLALLFADTYVFFFFFFFFFLMVGLYLCGQ